MTTLETTAQYEVDVMPAGSAGPVSPVSYDERRSERRYETGDFSEIVATDTGLPYLVQIMDVSRSGLRLRTTTALNPRTIITLYLKDMSVEGRICYCRLNDAGTFDAGVVILDWKNSR